MRRALSFRPFGLLCLVSASLITGLVFAADPVPNNPKPRADLARILKSWEATSARINALEVHLIRRDINPAWGSDTEFRGRALLEQPDRARLEFWKDVVTANKETRREDQEWVICSGTSVYQYNFATKQIFVYALSKQQQAQVLGEGPTPFLFNFVAKKALERYQLDVVKETATSYVLRVIPRQQIDKESFHSALLSLNKKTYLPDAVVLTMPNEKDRKEYRFTSIKAQQSLNPELFVGRMQKGWSVVRNAEGTGKNAARPVNRK